MVGVAAGAVFAPMIATVTGWFDKHRSLAVSLVSAGMGVAPMTDLAVRALADHDLRLAHRAARRSRIVAWVLLVPAALLVRRRPAPRQRMAAHARRGAIPA